MSKPSIERTCETCQITFYAWPYEVRTGQGRFCSRPCASRANAIANNQPGGAWAHRAIQPRICKQCGKEFRPVCGTSRQRFCSHKCEGQSRRQRVQRACEQCGQLFETVPAKTRGQLGRFCSQACFAEYRRFAPRMCETCQQPFQPKTTTQRFCSVPCKPEQYALREWRWSDTPRELTCQTCGKRFHRSPAQIAPTGRYFCSHSCWATSRTGEISGRWLGGKSFEPYPPTFNEQFKRMIRERDGYLCAVCDAPDSKQVHHINYVKLDTNPDNCITLCKSCHSKTGRRRAYWQAFFEGFMAARFR